MKAYKRTGYTDKYKKEYRVGVPSNFLVDNRLDEVDERLFDDLYEEKLHELDYDSWEELKEVHDFEDQYEAEEYIHSYLKESECFDAIESKFNLVPEYEYEGNIEEDDLYNFSMSEIMEDYPDAEVCIKGSLIDLYYWLYTNNTQKFSKFNYYDFIKKLDSDYEWLEQYSTIVLSFYDYGIEWEVR